MSKNFTFQSDATVDLSYLDDSEKNTSMYHQLYSREEFDSEVLSLLAIKCCRLGSQSTN